MSRHPKRPPAIPNLPPAGHERDEELRRRTDKLEQQGEEQFANATSISTDAFKEDHDAQVALRQAGMVSDGPMDGNEVEGAEAGYVYCWAREEKPGEQVRWKLAKKVRMPDGHFAPLWEVVQGNDMPEFQKTRGVIDVRGYRKMVDCILLRARADRYRQYQIEQAELNHIRMHGTSEGFEDLARRSKGQIKVFSEADISDKTTLDKAMSMGMARNQFTKKLREGTAHQV